MRQLMIGAILLGLSSGCTTPSLFKPSRADVIEHLVPSAVQIVLERDGQRVRSASGVAIATCPSARGTECFVLTSGHALARRSEPDRVFVLFDRHRGAGVKAAATVVAHRDTDATDLALLPAQFGHRPALGDPTWVVASPWGRNLTLVGGIVSQVNLDPPGDRTAARFIVDASVSYGSSGGGVYAAGGLLVGVVEGYRTVRVFFEGDAPHQSIHRARPEGDRCRPARRYPPLPPRGRPGGSAHGTPDGRECPPIGQPRLGAASSAR